MTATRTPPKAKAASPAAVEETPQRWRVTREEYYRLDELGFFLNKKVERIHGEIFVMSPIGWKHSITVARVSDALRECFANGYFLLTQSTYPTEDSDPEPDVTVIAGKYSDYPQDPGTRALVVEVSDSSLKHDTGVKTRLYAAAGVPDYWVVDLVNRRVIVFRDPQLDASSDSGHSYQSRTEYAPGQSIIPLAVPNAVAVADLLP